MLGTLGSKWASAVLGVGDERPKRSISAELTAPKYVFEVASRPGSLALDLLEKRPGIVNRCRGYLAQRLDVRNDGPSTLPVGALRLRFAIALLRRSAL